MNCRRYASSILVASALTLACGARSGLECFGESCSSRLADDADDVGEDEGTGFEPPDERAPIRPRPGSGGRPDRPRPVDDFPMPEEQLPTDTPLSEPLAAPCAGGGTYFGSLDVTTEGGLRALEGCEVVDGDLVIFGGGISNLRPLSRLRLVTGMLRIASYEGALDGLEALESVHSLAIQDVSASSLEPLRGLRQIGASTSYGGTLEVSQNPALMSLSGLGSLLQLSSLTVADNPALTSLAGLNVPEELDTVFISRNARLRDIDGLSGLRAVQTMQIEELPSLRNLAGLRDLQSAGSLALIGTTGLASLELPTTSMDVLYVDNVAATTLNGLSGLTRVERAIIQNNPNLVDIDRLATLAELRELSVLDNPSLVRLPEFAGVVALDQLYVRNNVSLAAGPAFPLVAEAGSLVIADNPSLTSVTGFATLQRADALDISRNSSLTQLDLGTLSRARNVRITCNTALLESSLEGLRLSVDGTVDVWGNLGSPTPCQ